MTGCIYELDMDVGDTEDLKMHNFMAGTTLWMAVLFIMMYFSVLLPDCTSDKLSVIHQSGQCFPYLN